MAPHYQVYVKLFHHAFYNCLTEDVAHPTVIVTPLIFFNVEQLSLGEWARVRPEKVAQYSGFWDLCRPCNAFDFVKGWHILAQPTMHGQDLVIDQSCNWKHVEGRNKFLPKTYGIPFLTFFVESINFGDILTFMISAQKKYRLWELHFICEKQANAFNWLLSTVYVVTQE